MVNLDTEELLGKNQLLEELLKTRSIILTVVEQNLLNTPKHLEEKQLNLNKLFFN